MPATGIDPMLMRQAMGRFATGVAVITTAADGQPQGMTVNSLTSVSLDPALLLICFNKGARSIDAITAAGSFVVNVLSKRQQAIALRFAQRGEDHFEGLGLEYGEHRVPMVPTALAHLECDVDQTLDAGDHTVVFGAVTKVCTREGDPLGFFGGKFSDVIQHGQESEHWFF